MDDELEEPDVAADALALEDCVLLAEPDDDCDDDGGALKVDVGLAEREELVVADDVGDAVPEADGVDEPLGELEGVWLLEPEPEGLDEAGGQTSPL